MEIEMKIMDLFEKCMTGILVTGFIIMGSQIYQDIREYQKDKKEQAYWNEIRSSLKETPLDTMERLYRSHLDQMSKK